MDGQKKEGPPKGTPARLRGLGSRVSRVRDGDRRDVVEVRGDPFLAKDRRGFGFGERTPRYFPRRDPDDKRRERGRTLEPFGPVRIPRGTKEKRERSRNG